MTTRGRITASVILSAGLLSWASGAFAASTKERLQVLEQKMDRVERLLSNNDSETELLRRIQELQSENQLLRNEIEQLQFETQRGADRQRELYMDLDQRIQSIEAGGAVGLAAGMPGSTGIPGSAGMTAGNDSADYQAAFELLKEGRYEEGRQAFENFLARYPNSELRDNAQYWMAETYYVTQDYTTALAGFQSVIADYPASRKIPDAWLKVGYCNYELKNYPGAREALATAQSRYPETTAARLAAQRLQLMTSEGR
jgi:tol-pal system protein YbgF